MLVDMFARLLDQHRPPPTTSPLLTGSDSPTPSAGSDALVPPVSPSQSDIDMKDTSTSKARATRAAAYPKKKPSPSVADGRVTKRRGVPAKASPLTIAAASIISNLALKLHLEHEQEAHLRHLVLGEARLLEIEYQDEIRDYMHAMEELTMSSPESIDQQPEIRWEMRPCLVDFLVEAHQEMRLRPETLYLTLNILDRYISRRIVFTKHYQLVGLTALWIASKFEDAKDRIPQVPELIGLCHGAYDAHAFIQMEVHVLVTLGWLVGHPTAEAWLRFVCTGSDVEDQATQHVARFLMEISLFHREYLRFTSSAIASGALCLARFIMGKTRKPHLESSSGLDVVDMLDAHLCANAHDLSATLLRKYSYPYYSKASNVVLQFYLKGNRFRHSFIESCPPITPLADFPCTPLSAASSTSSMDSEMPITPVTPLYVAEPFVNTNGRKRPVIPLGKIPRSEDGGVDRMALLEINGLAASPILTTAR